MDANDQRKQAAEARRRHAAREGQTARTYPPGAGRNRGLGPPQAPARLTVAEVRAELEQEG